MIMTDEIENNRRKDRRRTGLISLVLLLGTFLCIHPS